MAGLVIALIVVPAPTLASYDYDGPARVVSMTRVVPYANTTTVPAGEHRTAAVVVGQRTRTALRSPTPSLGHFPAAKAGSKLVEGARYPLSPKIQGQFAKRGWTTETIDEAVQSGKQVRAVNKATGNPATRYVHPNTGQSVVIDDVTGQVIHVGGPGFKYGPGSGDVP